MSVNMMRPFVQHHKNQLCLKHYREYRFFCFCCFRDSKKRPNTSRLAQFNARVPQCVDKWHRDTNKGHVRKSKCDGIGDCGNDVIKMKWRMLHMSADILFLIVK